jgi:hypothetical protein
MKAWRSIQLCSVFRCSVWFKNTTAKKKCYLASRSWSRRCLFKREKEWQLVKTVRLVIPWELATGKPLEGGCWDGSGTPGHYCLKSLVWVSQLISLASVLSPTHFLAFLFFKWMVSFSLLIWCLETMVAVTEGWNRCGLGEGDFRYLI